MDGAEGWGKGGQGAVRTIPPRKEEVQRSRQLSPSTVGGEGSYERRVCVGSALDSALIDVVDQRGRDVSMD